MITSFTSDLISGTGVTIRPELGLSAGWILDAAGHLDQVAVAAAHVHSSTTIRAPGGSLYGRSQPNAGADNTATTTIVLVRGHL
jgi:hypothetical protein